MKPLHWIILLVVVGLGLWGWSCHMKKVGELNGKIAHWQQEQKRTDTVYVRDTLRLTRVRRLTDSILTVDTIIHTDTVRLIVDRERQACNAVIATCEARVAVRDSIIKVLKRKPSVWNKVPWFVGGVVVGKLLLK